MAEVLILTLGPDTAGHMPSARWIRSPKEALSLHREEMSSGIFSLDVLTPPTVTAPLHEICVAGHTIRTNLTIAISAASSKTVIFRNGDEERTFDLPRPTDLRSLETALIEFVAAATGHPLVESLSRLSAEVRLEQLRRLHLLRCVLSRFSLDPRFGRASRHVSHALDPPDFFPARDAKVEMERGDHLDAEVDRRRTLSESRFNRVVAGIDCAPRIVYQSLTATNIADSLRRSMHGTIMVSLHTKSYFLLLLALAEADIACTAITTPQLAERLAASRFPYPTGLRFESGLRPSTLRDCRAGRRLLFIMADVMVGDGPNMLLPVFGRGRLYTVTWARLAERWGLDAYAAVLRDRGTTAEVTIRPLDKSRGAFDLAVQAFRAFEEALQEDMSDWENEPLWTRGSIALPDAVRTTPDEFLRFMYAHAINDAATALRVKEAREAHWPPTEDCPGSPSPT